MKIKTIILLLFFFQITQAFSQGGGPPMITTDPGTPGNKHWEINTSFNFSLTSQTSLQLPLVEVVRGFGENFQISVLLPSPEKTFDNQSSITFSQPQLGAKYRLLDEDKQIVSLAVYPQIIIPLDKSQQLQFFLPVELEKTFGRFRIGEEFGYFLFENPHEMFNGTVIGYRFKNDWEVMSEFFLSKQMNQSNSTNGLLNFGFRKEVSKHFVAMASCGTQLITPHDEEHQKLFGLIGFQILLGE